MEANLNSLKKHVFFEMLNLASRVFILVRHSENVVLGNRGFSDEEKEKGIILVFNSRMNFLWDDYGITATLVFGTSPQKCFIPVDDIMAVYSPDLNAQFMASPQPLAISGPQPIGSQKEGEKSVKKIEPKKGQKTKTQKDEKQGHVIKVDFTKKRK
ncbi:hypothetical protein [Dissulfurispira sp.]|uniref:hypothetical protein n=1 Tax=Dissulfurispira sp. TaxID=2817609 RepID=UPI002FDA60B4